MHLVILAAGEGSRMRPLTETTPKPLIQICGKSIIEHNIENIIHEFEGIYIIIKYKQEVFREYFWNEYKWKKITYIEQSRENWTGAAILSLKWKIDGEFIVLSWDDMYDSEDILKLKKQSGYATLCKQVEKPSDFGIFHVESWTGKVLWIIEKPTDSLYGNLANIGNHKLDSTIFWELESLPLSPRGEREITDLIDIYIKKWIYNVVEATGRWITVGYPWDILKIQDEIIGNYTETINKWAIIEPNVFINWNLYLEEGVILKSGTYIEGNVYFGKGTIVWPYTHIRWNTHFWESAKAGSFSEIKWCHFWNKTVIAQSAVIVDTVAWNNVNFASGVITTNLRHDGKNIRSVSKDSLIDTWRRKLWAIVWDNVHFWANTTTYPGRIIPTNGTTLPWEIVK